MSEKLKNSYRNRLHLLMRNEPHPDTLNSFGNQVRWVPQPRGAGFQRIFQMITSDLSLVQRLLIKLPLRMALTAEEGLYLSLLHKEGRYRSDQNPTTFLFCIGRCGGKTRIATRLAFLRNLIDPTVLYTFNISQARALNNAFDFVQGIGDFPRCDTFSGSYAYTPEQHCVIDEMLRCPQWEGINTQALDSLVGLFSLTGSGVQVNLGNTSTLAISLSHIDTYPNAYTPHYEMNPQQLVEFRPPPVSDWLHHDFGEPK